MSNDLRIDLERMLGDVARLAQFGAGPDGGVTRFTLSPAYLEAREWLSEQMEEVGLSCWVDGAGNLIGRLGGNGPAVMMGSHIDTAPSGGRLDGAYGVLAGLECLRALLESGAEIRPTCRALLFPRRARPIPGLSRLKGHDRTAR